MGTRSIYQQGSALITAILLVALIVILVSGETIKQRLSINITQQMFDADKAYLTALGIEAWAKGWLSEQLMKQSDKKLNAIITHPPWPITSPQITLYNGKIEGQLIDLQSLYNINNLRDAKKTPYFIHLLTLVYPTMSPEKINQLVESIHQQVPYRKTDSARQEIQFANMINLSYTGSVAKLGNVMDDGWQGKRKGKINSIKNINLTQYVSVSELRYNLPLTQTEFLKIQPYLIALPETTTINVNTAPLLVLQSLLPQGKEDFAEKIMLIRDQQAGFTSVDQFKALMKEHGIGEADNLPIGVESNYFLARAFVQIGTVNLLLHSVLRAERKSEKITVKVLLRSLGTM